jgi:exopolysaccharide biosynthesis WecB/TagA/CpsF family protein
MRDVGKQNLLGVLVDALDYEAAVARIIDAARERRGFSGSALAVHGVMTGRDEEHRFRLNHLDLVTPDGQPVRWSLNLLYRTGLKDRVYGPILMLKTCEVAARESLPIYLYGSTQAVVDRLAPNLRARWPGLEIAGAEPSKFRATSAAEKSEIAARIKGSGARITFVGLGCPRQEVFAYEYRDALGMPVIAVGAAFDYHAGMLTEPPRWVQRAGLQWLYRLAQDPRRLWKRYLILNTGFVALLALQLLHVWRRDPERATRPDRELRYS